MDIHKFFVWQRPTLSHLDRMIDWCSEQYFAQPHTILLSQRDFDVMTNEARRLFAYTKPHEKLVREGQEPELEAPKLARYRDIPLAAEETFAAGTAECVILFPDLRYSVSSEVSVPLDTALLRQIAHIGTLQEIRGTLQFARFVREGKIY